jgi:hypothetical protein
MTTASRIASYVPTTWRPTTKPLSFFVFLVAINRNETEPVYSLPVYLSLLLQYRIHTVLEWRTSISGILRIRRALASSRTRVDYRSRILPVSIPIRMDLQCCRKYYSIVSNECMHVDRTRTRIRMLCHVMHPCREKE